MLPIVAIIGRPNVGKSTLFNRLVGKRIAIESKFPGTTRDLIYQEAEMDEFKVILVDTGGLEFEKKESIEKDVQMQARIAIAEANLLVFMIDLREELTPSDLEVTSMIRKSKIPSILVANKGEKEDSDFVLANLFKLGLGQGIKVSARFGFGIENLEKEIVQNLKKMHFHPVKEKVAPKDDDIINIAIIGRPNVGKSSLINALLKKERLIVSDIAGTTRDAVDSLIIYEDQKYNLIDTAGIKRKGRIQKILDKFSFGRSLQAIERCDTAILMVDYSDGITSQDCHTASYILEQGKGLIIAVNKCDLITEDTEEKDRFIREMQGKLDFLSWAPVIFMSAKSGKNVNKIYDLTKEIREQRSKRIETAELNVFLHKAKMKHPPAMGGRTRNKKPKIYYLTQTDINPPTFVFFVNERNAFHFSYRRYLENELRKTYGFGGTVIKMKFKNKGE